MARAPTSKFVRKILEFVGQQELAPVRRAQLRACPPESAHSSAFPYFSAPQCQARPLRIERLSEDLARIGLEKPPVGA
jgi:hypothetical protein